MPFPPPNPLPASSPQTGPRAAATGQLSWQIIAMDNWVEVTPSSGTGGGEVTVRVLRDNLQAGRHQCSLHVSSNGGLGVVDVRVFEAPDGSKKDKRQD